MAGSDQRINRAIIDQIRNHWPEEVEALEKSKRDINLTYMMTMNERHVPKSDFVTWTDDETGQVYKIFRDPIWGFVIFPTKILDLPEEVMQAIDGMFR